MKKTWYTGVGIILIVIVISLRIVSRKKADDTAVIPLKVINQSRWAGNIEQAVNDWNGEHPDRQIKLDQLVIGYPQLRNKLITAAGAGSPPDISLMDSVWLAEFADAGHLAALDNLDPEWFKTDYKEDFFSVFQEGEIFKGHLWGVRTQTDMALLWYRKDWFEQENLSAPATWDELVKASKRFQEKQVRNRYGNSGFPLALPLGQKARETLVYQVLPLFWSNGGEVIRGNRSIVLNSQQNIETLGFLKDLVQVHKVVSPEATTFEWNRPMKLFATGKVAMAFGGSYEKRMIQDISGWSDAEFLRYAGYTLIPAGPSGKPKTTAGGMCYVVYEKSPNKKLAMEILKLALSNKNMKKFLLETYQHPPRISIAENLNEKLHPFLAGTAQYLYKARTRPNFPEYSKLSDLLQQMIEDTVSGKKTPQEAVEQTEKRIKGLIK